MFSLQASTPYSLESDSLGMDCIISGSASPTLAINTVTNKVATSAIQAVYVPTDPCQTATEPLLYKYILYSLHLAHTAAVTVLQGQALVLLSKLFTMTV